MKKKNNRLKYTEATINRMGNNKNSGPLMRFMENIIKRKVI